MRSTNQHIIHWLRTYPKRTEAFFIIFFAVGIIGLLFPFSYPLFIQLTPLALVLSFLALLVFHRSQLHLRTFAFFALVYFSSFAIEAMGVHTGNIFGEYYYGSGLGMKLWDTPLIIGLNWVFMVYSTAVITDLVRGSNALKVVGGATLMLAYDLVLEQVAPVMDMWSWKDDEVPLQNYLAWFIMAIVYHLILRLLNIQLQNRMATFLFIIQLAFFVILMLFLNP